MRQEFDLSSLAGAVRDWCDSHDIVPASGQVAETLSERTIRYYRTIGLLDAPLSSGGGGFGEKHFLQLVAIRILQAQGIPLRRIREVLFGRSIDELRVLQARGGSEAKSRPKVDLMPGTEEVWRTIPISQNHLLICRSGKPVPAAVLDEIRSILQRAGRMPVLETEPKNRRNQKK